MRRADLMMFLLVTAGFTHGVWGPGWLKLVLVMKRTARISRVAIYRYRRLNRDTEVAGTFPKLPVRHGPDAYD